MIPYTMTTPLIIVVALTIISSLMVLAYGVAACTHYARQSERRSTMVWSTINASISVIIGTVFTIAYGTQPDSIPLLIGGITQGLIVAATLAYSLDKR